MSALFGAAFGIQNSNMRAGANHEIQSTGGQITKEAENDIWDIQPTGIHDWYVRPMNVHDEVMTACDPCVSTLVKSKVDKYVTRRQADVPLLEIEWSTNMSSWAEK
jgi:hypothetical protein